MESSTAKGTKLEDQVYDLVSKLLKQDQFIVSKKRSKVFKKKGYFSPKRNKDIIFDVTIETTLPNAEKYSLLTIIECKNLNKNVTVDDIEEFGSKINQVGEHNTKGIIITTHTFQESALNIAKSEGIGLVRINSKNEIQWINYRKENKNSFEFNNSLELTDELHLNEPFIASINNRRLTNFADILLELSIIDYFNDSEEFIDIPFVNHERLNYIINKLYAYNIYEGAALNFDKLISLLEDKYKVKFEFDTEDPNYLGKIEFNPLCIKISKYARIDNNRWRFTLAHEIGHLILHSSLLKERIKEKGDKENTLSLKYSSTNKNSERLEIQANLFASYLLLPEIILIPKMKKL